VREIQYLIASLVHVLNLCSCSDPQWITHHVLISSAFTQY